MKNVYVLIRTLGITSKYKGYYFLAEAICCAMEMPDRPMKITKDIYPILASKFKASPINVEHDIRTLVNVCWKANKKGLDEIAGYTMQYKPTNSEFIDMLAFYLKESEEITDQYSSNRT